MKRERSLSRLLPNPPEDTLTLPITQYTATAGQTDYDVVFPYISRTHVKVTGNFIPYTILEWLSPTRIRLSTAPPTGALVEVYRETPTEGPLVEFQNGAVLTQEDLNLAVKQLLYKQQELAALYDNSLKKARQRLAENSGVVTDPETVVDDLVQQVLQSQLLADLRTRYQDIDLNASNILQTALNLDTLTNDFNTEAVARAQAEAALNSSIGTINSTISTLEADLTDLIAVVDGLANLETGGIATLISNEEQARIDGDTALAAKLSLLGAVSGDNLSFILDQSKVKVSPTESLGQRLSAITSKANANEARIIAEETTRANADSALSSSITALTATVNSNNAQIISEAAARADADTALSQTIGLIGVKNGAGDAFIFNLNTARISGTETLAQRLNSINASIGSNAAAITSEATARTNADNALSASITALQATVGNNTAAITAEQLARADGDSALVADINVLSARVTSAENGIVTNAAAIVNEQSARANGDSANASAISALTTTVNGNTATVATLQSSVNGLLAKYGVLLDVNGYVTGFVQNNNGQTGEFIILADRFAIVDPNGGPGQTPVVPFEVSGGAVKINGNLVVDGTISSTKIADNAVTDLDYYFSSFGTLSSSGSLNVWRNSAASVTVVAPNNAVGVMLDLVAQLDRGGGSDDTLSFRIYRSDGAVLPQVYSNCKVEGGRRPYGFKFTDPNPPAGSVTYTLQVLSTDDWPTWHDTTLTAALFKK